MRASILGSLALLLAATALAQQEPPNLDPRAVRDHRAFVEQRFTNKAPEVGALGPDLQLQTPDGELRDLRDLTREGHTVLVLGCLTTPPFLRNVAAMEALERDFAPRGVRFLYVYKALAHPEYHHWIAPFTAEERRLQAAEAARGLGTRIPWLVDRMDNALLRVLGHAPNAELLIGPGSRIVGRRAWNDPAALRAELAELVGAPERATRAEDLDLPRIAPPPTETRGIVQRPRTTQAMRPLRVELLDGGDKPLYAKPRIEAEMGFFDDPELSGAGKVYLGFHLDPLHQMHWNGRAESPTFGITSPEALRITPTQGAASKVDIEADSDPREFLVDLEAERLDLPFDLTFAYEVCDAGRTFCEKVRQEYRIHLEWDRDGGSVLARGPLRKR